MENFKIRTNEFKNYLPVRKGLVIEFNGEGVIGIVPSSKEESFILFENGSRRIITESLDFQFDIPDFDDDIRIEFKIGEGLEISTSNDNEKRSYFIPVKSDWVVEFRNRRACGKTRIQGNSVWLGLRKKGN